jgi:hypothetical protein
MMFDMTEAVDYRRIEETDTSPAGPLPLLEGFEIDYIPDIVAIICQIKYVHDASDMPRYAFTPHAKRFDHLTTICQNFCNQTNGEQHFLAVACTFPLFPWTRFVL